MWLHALALAAALGGAAGPRPPTVRPAERALFVGHTFRVDRAEFSPDGKLLATGGGDNRGGELKLWDVATGKEVGPFAGYTNSLDAAEFSPDGRLLATAGGDRVGITVWDVATRQPRSALRREPPGYTSALAFGPDGKTLAALGGGRAAVWDLAAGRQLRGFDLTGRQWGALGPDARLAAAANYQEVDLWDLARGATRPTLAGHRGAVKCLAFTADGRTLASASHWQDDDRGWHGEVRLWDAAAGRARGAVPAAVGYPLALAVRPDGKAVAVYDWVRFDGDFVARLLDAGTGREVWAERRPTRSWLNVSFAPDGTLRILDSPDGKKVRLRELPAPAAGRP